MGAIAASHRRGRGIYSEVSTVVIVAAAVIRRHGKVLITRRPAGAHLAGLWEFPGGKVEADEDPVVAVARECREECAIEIAVRDIFDVTFHRYSDKSVLLLFYACDLPAGEPKNVQIAEHAWVSPGELTRYELPPADAGVVRKLQTNNQDG